MDEIEIQPDMVTSGMKLKPPIWTNNMVKTNMFRILGKKQLGNTFFN